MVRSWVELTDNPDSYMLLMDNGPDGLPDPATELRVPLHRGARFVVDTQRLWHVVVHPGDAPRYALITSFETGPTLERWVDANLPARVAPSGAGTGLAQRARWDSARSAMSPMILAGGSPSACRSRRHRRPARRARSSSGMIPPTITGASTPSSRSSRTIVGHQFEV